MKTAVVCWCLFSVAFALPIPNQNSRHANALKESNIKQNFHSSGVSYNTKTQKDLASSDASGTASPVFNRDMKLGLEAWDSGLGPKGADLVSDLGLRPKELPSLYDAVQKRDSHSSEVNHDAEADENSVALDEGDYIIGWQSDEAFDENYAANNPEITDEFVDDSPQNYFTNMAKDAEDQSVETE